VEAAARDFVTVVSGVPRSGTSLVMQMLVAGGLPVLADGARPPDCDNPHGYLEYEPVKRLARDAGFVALARGRAVKVIHALLRFLPPGERYRVIFVERAIGEVVASQSAMLARRGERAAPLPSARLGEILSAQAEEARAWLARRPDARLLRVRFADLLARPEASAAAIDRFVGGGLDVRAMAAAVDPDCPRSRSPARWPADPPRADPARTRRVAIFDLGGVLVDWDPRRLYRKLFGDEAAMERFLASVCTQEWNVRQDAGRPLDEGIAELVGRHPEHRALIEAWRDRFLEMLEPMSESIAILAELRERGTPLYALSNWGAETFAATRPRLPFLEWFDGLVISGHVRCIKPDPAIFRHLFRSHGVDPRDAVFVDDHLPNVESARRLGLHGILFGGASALRGQLEDVGLLPPARRRRTTGDGESG
jgi:2-haloacid dehalogenase